MTISARLDQFSDRLGLKLSASQTNSSHAGLTRNNHDILFFNPQSKKLATGADPSPLIRELSQLTTQNIDNSLIFGGDLDRATDIMAAIVQHNGQTELIDMTREDVEVYKKCVKFIECHLIITNCARVEL